MNLASTQFSVEKLMFEIYVSGCREHPCKGCYSTELWDENVGLELTDEEYKKLKINIKSKMGIIENFMICGGEPLEKPKEDVLKLIKFLKQFKLPIWLFTRFELKDIDKEILDEVEYVKCGMYIEGKPSIVEQGITLASSNQTIYVKRKEDNKFIVR